MGFGEEAGETVWFRGRDLEDNSKGAGTASTDTGSGLTSGAGGAKIGTGGAA